ncbi:hypothetical protein HMI54_014252, partial [Coelomomyces lativittatus]
MKHSSYGGPLVMSTYRVALPSEFAGCGRSGTFIAVDFITRYLEDAMAYPDFEHSEDIVYTVVMDLRRQRVQMVQTC